MNKWDKTYWGKTVVATSLAVERGIAKNKERGILLGTAAHGLIYKVVPEGRVTPSSYSSEFWSLEWK